MPGRIKSLKLPEFIALIALMISLVALSIDAMLPALPTIGDELGASGNATQWVISAMFFGFAIGQMIYGPVSDSIGRKPTIYIGALIFVVGCVLSMTTTTFALMLVGRALQGVGAASPRTVSLALVRDQYAGRDMAKVMSIIMSVFILVPAVAPAVGQGVLAVSSWRAIFLVLLVQALISVAWFGLRQPETLLLEDRVRFSPRSLFSSMKRVLTDRVAFGYTVVATLVSGAFIGYLVSSQQIFEDVFHAGDRFAIFFACLALSIGAASLVNSRLVGRLGMKRLVASALIFNACWSAAFVVVTQLMPVSLPLFMGYMAPLFFGIGILFGNTNAMAMEPMGEIAGMAAAVIGSVTTFGSLAIGTMIAQLFNSTVVPLVSGFLICSVLAAVSMWLIERGRTVVA